MVRHFLFSPMKHHRKHCPYDYHMRVRVAISSLLLFFSALAIYMTERYIFQIPIPIAIILVILLSWYLITTFFELAVLDHKDGC